MTDYKCLSYWTGSAWSDMSNAAPAFAGGTSPSYAIAPNASVSLTVLSFTLGRPASLAIILSGTYYAAYNVSQTLSQRILVDGSGSTAQQLGGSRTGVGFSASAPGNDGAHGGQTGTATSLQMATGLSAGAHTIGIGIDMGDATFNDLTLEGTQVLALISFTGSSL